MIVDSASEEEGGGVLTVNSYIVTGDSRVRKEGWGEVLTEKNPGIAVIG